MNRIRLAIALALLAALPATGAASAAEARPMRGHFTVGVVPTEQRCGPNLLTIGFEGAGLGTHLGRFTGSGTNCTTFDLATSSVPITAGVAHFVAADGSTITTHYEGVQHAPVAGIAAIEATHTVVSGSGRFAGASGVWASSGTIDFTTGTSSATLSGWVSY